MRGRPYILVVDPANVCNLRCPLCPTGLLAQNRKSQLMAWETYTRAVDLLAPWAYKVNLFNWGESLLHPRLCDMIRYAGERNLGTNLSTNLSLELDDDRLDSLIASGLEFICLSIDGATQETYARYRRRGKLELVLENVRRLLERRRDLSSATPIVEWQFIPMRHNQHELEDARRTAMEMGVDRFRTIPVGIPFGSADPEALKSEWFPVGVPQGTIEDGRRMPGSEPEPRACYFLYRYFVVNAGGGVAPCCVVFDEKHDFADLESEEFAGIWNNEMYRSARAHYVKGGRVEVPTVCDQCDLFEKRARYPGP